MVLIDLFLAFSRISLFAIGGAYSFLPFIEREIVDKHQWLSRNEFLEILGITQVFPGAISIKFATYAGYKIAGIPGAIFANLGNILAPALIVITLSIFYTKFKDSAEAKSIFEMIRLVVFAMIIALAFRTVDIHELAQIKSILVISIAFIIFTYTKLHPAFILILAGTLGIFWR